MIQGGGCKDMQGWEEAVVDRIVDETLAVLLVGPGEEELVVQVELLPEGSREGSILHLKRSPSAETVEFVLDQEETDRVMERVRAKIEYLRQRTRKRR